MDRDAFERYLLRTYGYPSVSFHDKRGASKIVFSFSKIELLLNTKLKIPVTHKKLSTLVFLLLILSSCCKSKHIHFNLIIAAYVVITIKY